jgi:hypothetical protein
VQFLDEFTDFPPGRGRGSLDGEPSAEDTGILQSLMNAGHADRVEFCA